MENVILTIHLILAVLLAGVVLLQRSEGGGLGLGSSSGGLMTNRQAANVLTRLTWIFGVALFCTSLALTIMAARGTGERSIMDQIGVSGRGLDGEATLPDFPAYTPPPLSGDLMVPPSGGDEESPGTAFDAPGEVSPAADVGTPPAAN